MTGIVWVIFAGVIAAVIAFGLVTKLLEGVAPAWKHLAEKYPPQPSLPDAIAGETRLLIIPTTHPGASGRGGRSGAPIVAYLSDDDHLHLRLLSGRSGPLSAMSLPWSEAEFAEPSETHNGRVVAMTIDGVMMLVPEAAVEREMAIRHQMSQAPPPYDPLVEEIN